MGDIELGESGHELASGRLILGENKHDIKADVKADVKDPVVQVPIPALDPVAQLVAEIAQLEAQVAACERDVASAKENRRMVELEMDCKRITTIGRDGKTDKALMHAQSTRMKELHDEETVLRINSGDARSKLRSKKAHLERLTAIFKKVEKPSVPKWRQFLSYFLGPEIDCYVCGGSGKFSNDICLIAFDCERCGGDGYYRLPHPN